MVAPDETDEYLVSGRPLIGNPKAGLFVRPKNFNRSLKQQFFANVPEIRASRGTKQRLRLNELGFDSMTPMRNPDRSKLTPLTKVRENSGNSSLDHTRNTNMRNKSYM
jgi:hypothetical protein